MLYQAYQAHSDIMVPVRSWATAALRRVRSASGGRRRQRGLAQPVRRLRAYCPSRTHARAPGLRDRQRHGRQPRGRGARARRADDAVRDAAAFQEGHRYARSRACCVVAPLSGHFATLLRGTVRTMLPEHDVYITDWHNVRDVPLIAWPVRLRRIYRASDPVSWRRSVRALMWWRCASPAWPSLVAAAVMAQSRQCRAAAQHDPDGGSDRHPRQSDQGQRARQLEADGVVRAQPDRLACRCAIRARSAGSIRASCSSPRS